MSVFVVPPKPEFEKIPVITADELGDALRAYIEATYPTFSHTGQSIDGDDGETWIYFTGRRTDAPSKPMNFEVTIHDKAARSWQSKLFNKPFDVTIRSGDVGLTRGRLLIEPLADRSISIGRILRWENGRPVVEV